MGNVIKLTKLSLRAGVYTGVAIFILNLKEKIPTSLRSSE